jgi:hypothetical protein
MCFCFHQSISKTLNVLECELLLATPDKRFVEKMDQLIADVKHRLPTATLTASVEGIASDKESTPIKSHSVTAVTEDICLNP